MRGKHLVVGLLVLRLLREIRRAPPPATGRRSGDPHRDIHRSRLVGRVVARRWRLWKGRDRDLGRGRRRDRRPAVDEAAVWVGSGFGEGGEDAGGLRGGESDGGDGPERGGADGKRRSGAVFVGGGPEDVIFLELGSDGGDGGRFGEEAEEAVGRRGFLVAEDGQGIRFHFGRCGSYQNGTFR